MDTSKVPISKDECSGCTACHETCPKQAITMLPDSEGFIYPSIEEDKCVNCGLCAKFCAFSHDKVCEKENNLPETVQLFRHKDLDVRMKSRSGGVFTAISDWILDNDGIVYGCVLSGDNYVRHIKACSKADRNQMRKSKYVQSDLTGIFMAVKNDLQNEKIVLFTGTGCQVAGLLSFLDAKRINIRKLYTLDIVCHGCVSPLIFKDYIKWLEEKYKGNVEQFQFRDKTRAGWEGYKESCVINGKIISSTVYKALINTDMALRPACYHCKYARVNRNSDITIGDAWGIKKVADDFNDNRGTSLIITHTEKGRALLAYINDDYDCRDVPIQPMLQSNLRKPSKPNGNREKFWGTYYSQGFDVLAKMYGKVPLNKIIKNNIKYKAKQMVQSHKYYLP
jgi:coenzyme F420-reducing hydrogenase beta subunit